MAVEEDPPASVPEWVVTFGDMMSLLLTFFIMLVSMSQVKQDEQYEAMAQAMRERFGHKFFFTGLIPGTEPPQSSRFDLIDKAAGKGKEDSTESKDDTQAPSGANFQVRVIRSGDVMTDGGVVYFAEGQTDLTEEEKQQLKAVVERFGGKPQKIEIRGHTSRMPAALKPMAKDIQGRFVDNWHLAYTRCHHVMEFLVGLGIDPTRIRMSVAGEYEPIYTGLDAEQRKRNERVEIFMLNERVPEQEVSGKKLPADATKTPAQPKQTNSE